MEIESGERNGYKGFSECETMNLMDDRMGEGGRMK